MQNHMLTVYLILLLAVDTLPFIIWNQNHTWHEKEIFLNIAYTLVLFYSLNCS